MKIYLVKDASGFAKIGRAAHPASRLIHLQCANSQKLELVFIGEGDHFVELALHSHYEDRWVRGEWFRDQDNEITNTIADALKKVTPVLAPRLIDQNNKKPPRRSTKIWKPISDYMKRHQLNNIGMAEFLGVSPSQIASWVRRQRSPRTPMLKHIWEKTGIPFNDLLESLL